MPPNGPELSCGGEPRRPGIQSARGNPRPIVAGCFARAKSSTAGSVSLSDWLGGKPMAELASWSMSKLGLVKEASVVAPRGILLGECKIQV